MYAPAPHRTSSALAASLIVTGGLLALALGLSPAPPSVVPRHVLKAILPTRSIPPAPRPRAAPREARVAAAGNAPAPPVRKAGAAPIVLPSTPPPVTVPLVKTVPVAGATSDRGGGEAAGSGQGAGAGAGLGAGTGGSGAGAGTGRPSLSAYPRQIAGKLNYSEIPQELRHDHGGVVRLRYRIGIDGRVSDCMVLQSSGLPDFDRQTCTSIAQRFRFKPARDPLGRAVPFTMTETHGWDYEPDDRRPPGG